MYGLYSSSCVHVLIVVFVSFFFVPQWILESGFIRQLCSGVYHLLPLVYRVLDNIVILVEHEWSGWGQDGGTYRDTVCSLEVIR